MRSTQLSHVEVSGRLVSPRRFAAGCSNCPIAGRVLTSFDLTSIGGLRWLARSSLTPAACPPRGCARGLLPLKRVLKAPDPKPSGETNEEESTRKRALALAGRGRLDDWPNVLPPNATQGNRKKMEYQRQVAHAWKTLIIICWRCLSIRKLK